MKEDCANGMSAPHGCTDDTAVVETFKEALKQRIGADRFRMWFQNGVEFSVVDRDDARPGHRDLLVSVRGQFALDRMRQNFLRELRGAAAQAGGGEMGVRVAIAEPTVAASADTGSRRSGVGATTGINGSGGVGAGVATAVEAARSTSTVAASTSTVAASTSTVARGDRLAGVHALGSIPAAKFARGVSVAGDRSVSGDRRPEIGGSTTNRSPSCGGSVSGEAVDVSAAGGHDASGSPGAVSPGAVSPADTSSAVGAVRGAMTMETFVAGDGNELALTAAKMSCREPSVAAPLLLVGSSGVGKTHLMSAIADRFRRGRRMRRVIQLTAEQFTNDFIKSVGSSGLPAFRRRYRDVDALLIDDVQFLAAKKATLREMLYTIDTLAAAGRPLVFTADRPPAEIPGLTKELAGRMSAGLVCPIRPLDRATRETLLRRLIDERCLLSWPDAVIAEINGMLAGDGRTLGGIVNLVGTLQRMYRRMPTMDEIRTYGGDLLRSQSPVVTLSAIERAVCRAFELDDRALREGGQTRSITEPRMLAMYLSRQLTSSAFSEIARHYGGKSHTTALAANRKVETWLGSGRSIGRGRGTMSARQAIERVENILRAG